MPCVVAHRSHFWVQEMAPKLGPGGRKTWDIYMFCGWRHRFWGCFPAPKRGPAKSERTLRNSSTVPLFEPGNCRQNWSHELQKKRRQPQHKTRPRGHPKAGIHIDAFVFVGMGVGVGVSARVCVCDPTSNNKSP